MKEQAFQKDSSLAWYKLAELVSRGEKEKVLNLYRLLSHSFEDKAYALQVEGDILLAFADKAAISKYQQAAYLYKSEHKFIAALGIYEHLASLECENIEHLFTLVEVYALLDWVDKFKERFQASCEYYKKQRVPRTNFEKFLRSLIKTVKGYESFGRSINEQFLKEQITLCSKELNIYI